MTFDPAHKVPGCLEIFLIQQRCGAGINQNAQLLTAQHLCFNVCIQNVRHTVSKNILSGLL